MFQYLFVSGRGISTPRLAGKFVKMHKEWLADRIDNITTHLARE